MLVRRDLFVPEDLDEMVPVPEGRIHFVKRGSGINVVLLHPMGTSVWAWHRVIDSLAQHFTCYAFDMPGHGDSEAPSGDFAIPDFARAMDHAMQVLNIHRTHVIGNSVGAALAIELAASFPGRVDRLVLVGAPLWDPRAAPQRIKEAGAGYDAKGASRPRTLDELRAAGTFANPRPEWVEKTNELRARAGVWVRKTSESLAWYDVMSRLPRIKATATLVLYGEHDRLRDGEDLLCSNISNARKVVLPGLGHIPQVEGPEAFTSAVLPFLS
jgi:3-oxoadipate enol-lactonase